MGFLPENAHLTYLNFSFYSCLRGNTNPTITAQPTRDSIWDPTIRQKSQALQVVPVQRRPEDRYRRLLAAIYKHTAMSTNIQTPISLSIVGNKQMSRPLPSQGAFPHVIPIHTQFFLDALLLSLAIAHGNWFSFRNTVTSCCNTWKTTKEVNAFFCSGSHFLGAFLVPFMQGFGLCCRSVALSPSPPPEHQKSPNVQPFLGTDVDLGHISQVKGPLLKANLIANAV